MKGRYIDFSATGFTLDVLLRRFNTICCLLQPAAAFHLYVCSWIGFHVLLGTKVAYTTPPRFPIGTKNAWLRAGNTLPRPPSVALASLRLHFRLTSSPEVDLAQASVSVVRLP